MSTTAPSLKKNYLYNAFLTVTNLVIPVFSFSYIAPLFRPEVYGRVSFAQSTVNYFLLMASAGLPLYGAREVARVRNDSREKSLLVSELLLITCATTICSLLLYLVTIYLVPAMRASAPLFRVYALLLVVNLFNIDWFFHGEERYRNIALRSSICRIVSLASLFFFVREQDHFIRFAVLSVATVGAINLSGVLTARQALIFSLRALRPMRHIRPILILFGSAVTASVYVYLDTVMLGILSDEIHVGLYAAAVRISRIAVMLVLSLGAVALPRITYYLNDKQHVAHRELAGKSYHFLLFCALPTTIFMVTFSRQLLAVLTRNTFLDAAPALVISSLLVSVMAVSNFVGIQVLFPAGKEKGILYSTAAAAVINIALNLILIPRYHHNGAAVATLAAEAAAMVFLIVLARRHLPVALVSWRVAGYLVAALISGLCACGVVLITTNPVLVLTGGGAAYVLVYGTILLLYRDPTVIDALRTAIRFPGLRIMQKDAAGTTNAD